MFHRGDGRVQVLNLADDNGQILQHQPAGDFGMVLVKLFQVMPNTTTDIYQKCGFRRRVSPINEALLDWEDAWGHPWETTLTVAAHVVVKVLPVPLALQPREEV
jgi:hypothetical protein